MWKTKKTFRWKIICLNEVYKFSSRHFSTECIFYVLIIRNTIENISFLAYKYVICLLKSYWNVYRKSSAKRECQDENVFLKANRALSELNFLFHLNSKTNLVTLRKCVIHTQREISSGCGNRKNVVTYNVVVITTFNS